MSNGKNEYFVGRTPHFIVMLLPFFHLSTSTSIPPIFLSTILDHLYLGFILSIVEYCSSDSVDSCCGDGDRLPHRMRFLQRCVYCS